MYQNTRTHTHVIMRTYKNILVETAVIPRFSEVSGKEQQTPMFSPHFNGVPGVFGLKGTSLKDLVS